MRSAGEPLPIGAVAAGTLAAKGIALPDARTMQTRRRFQQIFSKWDKRGLVVRVRSGKHVRRRLTHT
jgi:hypothetical protein